MGKRDREKVRKKMNDGNEEVVCTHKIFHTIVGSFLWTSLATTSFRPRSDLMVSLITNKVHDITVVSVLKPIHNVWKTYHQSC